VRRRHTLIRKKVMKLILTCIMLIGPVSSALATEANYRCTDGTTVKAVFGAPGQAGSVQLTFARKAKSVELPQALSADGGRYADGDTEFWIKGKTARLTRAGAATGCATK
jgi:membrane-bound inhibitor of C-type lysozyme